MTGGVKGAHVALFFTRGISLRTWDEVGMFEREVALYRSLRDRGVGVTFVTHGDNRDLSYSGRLPGINILCNHRAISSKTYRSLLPLIHFRALRQATHFKTNQTDGGEIALRAAKILRKPLVARCGYMLSEFQSRKFGDGSRQAMRSLGTEKKLFSGADRVVVTTERMKSDIIKRVGINPEKVGVIPNYVDTELFYNRGESEKDFDLIFVGRIDPQKNLDQLLEAVLPLKARVLLVGNGPLKGELEQRFDAGGELLTWINSVPNDLLPDYMARSRIFVLPSLYEGHPKTLIEAMAMGMPVLGTDVPGIREVITHGQDGWLCPADVDSLRGAVKTLTADPDKCAILGEGARRTAEKNYSLDRIVKMEIGLMEDLLESGRQGI